MVGGYERIRLIGAQVEKLLTMLGLKVQSITHDETLSDDAYHVFCRKQIGKVNYVHHIPAFGSKSETEGFRVLCLYGTYNCDALMDKFRSVNATAKHTLVLLDFALNIEERRRLARKIKEEKSFSKTFIVIDRVVLFYLAKHYATMLAGLYRLEERKGLQVPVFSVLTRDATEELRAIHDRMPLILRREDVAAWVRPDGNPREISKKAVSYVVFEKVMV